MKSNFPKQKMTTNGWKDVLFSDVGHYMEGWEQFLNNEKQRKTSIVH
jgi:allantoicase